MLAQGEIYTPWEDATVDPASGENLYEGIADRVSSFRSNYAAWRAAQTDWDALAGTLSDARSVLTARRQELSRAGYETQALDVAVAETDSLEADRATLAETVSQWSGTWDLLGRWLSALSSTFGLGVVIVPVALSVAVALAAMSALAWFVTEWDSVRTRAATVKDLADRLRAGDLTTEQVRILAETSTAGGGLFAGWGTLGLVVVGGLVYIMIRGK